jgi:hypothetical protein
MVTVKVLGYKCLRYKITKNICYYGYYRIKFLSCSSKHVLTGYNSQFLGSFRKVFMVKIEQYTARIWAQNFTD